MVFWVLMPHMDEGDKFIRNSGHTYNDAKRHNPEEHSRNRLIAYILRFFVKLNALLFPHDLRRGQLLQAELLFIIAL
jgi:hypothetical protein